MLFSWIWCQTVGTCVPTHPCLAWPCGSLTCWPGLGSWAPGHLTSCYPLQCGWLASLIRSLFSQLSCKLWLEGSEIHDSGGWEDCTLVCDWISLSLHDRNEWPLDSMCLQCDVTKKNREDFSVAPREGAYVHGLYMEGARWDTQVLIQSLISVCFHFLTQVQWSCVFFHIALLTAQLKKCTWMRVKQTMSITVTSLFQ